jgi:hypothetical protein
MHFIVSRSRDPDKGPAPEVDRARYRSWRMEGRLACLLLTVLGSAQEPAALRRRLHAE